MNRRTFLTSMLFPALFSAACQRGSKNRSAKQSLNKDVLLSIDEQAQKIAERVIADPFRTQVKKRELPSDADIAFVCLRNATGDVLAYLGTLQEDSEFDNCRQSVRDIGSTVKPLIYAIALETGALSPDETFPDKPLSFQRLDQAGEYRPHNFNNSYTHRLLGIEEALALSSNSVALQVYHKIRQGALRAAITAMGLPLDYNINLLPLGRWSVTPLQLASVMTVFPNNGAFVAPRFLKTVSSEGGVRTELPIKRSAQIFHSDVCAIVSRAMRACVERGTGNVAADLAEVARGKTGTSQDLLSVLQSKEITTVLWLGRRNSNQDLKMVAGRTAMPALARYFRSLRKVRPEFFPLWG